MSFGVDKTYDFVFKALLTEEALDSAGRKNRHNISISNEELSDLLALDALDSDHVLNAERMSVVYIAIAAFENSVRELIARTLLEEEGEDWWEKCVSSKTREQARKRLEEEKKVRWHSQRGDDPINYSMLPNLINIIRNNYQHFEALIHDIEWAASIFDVIERSRNVIMHSGTLSKEDIARIGINIRDWNKQVGI